MPAPYATPLSVPAARDGVVRDTHVLPSVEVAALPLPPDPPTATNTPFPYVNEVKLLFGRAVPTFHASLSASVSNKFAFDVDPFAIATNLANGSSIDIVGVLV